MPAVVLWDCDRSGPFCSNFCIYRCIGSINEISNQIEEMD